MTNRTDEKHEERFVSVEVKLAYLEKTALELNEVIVLQDRRIEGLERQLTQLERHLRDDVDEGPPPHEKPPHY